MKIDYFVYNRRAPFEPFLDSFAKGIYGRSIRDLVLHCNGSNLVFELILGEDASVAQKVYVEQGSSLEEIKNKINEILDLHKSSAILVRTANIPDSNRYVAAVIVQSVTPPDASDNADPATTKATKTRQNKKGAAQAN